MIQLRSTKNSSRFPSISSASISLTIRNSLTSSPLPVPPSLSASVSSMDATRNSKMPTKLPARSIAFCRKFKVDALTSNPSCGLEYLPRDRAFAKLELLAKIRAAVAA